MLTLYSSQYSGNCYKLRLALHQTGTPFRLHDVDVLTGETRTPGFLAMNPNGKVPVLQLPDGRCLPESNAGLYYVAHGTPLLPDDLYERAQVLQWLFFEQYSHEIYIAVARFWWSLKPGGREAKADRFEEWRSGGYKALDVMEQHLQQQPFFVGGRYTIADIALYAYTHVAEEGPFDLSPYAAIRAWLERVASAPGHVPMSWRPAPR
jgi:glutathione S-transferase